MLASYSILFNKNVAFKPILSFFILNSLEFRGATVIPFAS